MKCAKVVVYDKGDGNVKYKLGSSVTLHIRALQH